MIKEFKKAETLATQIRTASTQKMYGFSDRTPSSIYIHSDELKGTTAGKVLWSLNSPLLHLIGIRFWQAEQSTDAYPDRIFKSLEEQSDSRPGATFSRTSLYRHLVNVFLKS